MSHVVHATGQPVSYSFSRVWWRGVDLNHRRHTPTDLQSVPFGHSGTPPLWSWRWDLNPQPADYKSAALPIELRQLPKRQTVSQARGICQVNRLLMATAGSPSREEGSLPPSPGEGKLFLPPASFFSFARRSRSSDPMLVAVTGAPRRCQGVPDALCSPNPKRSHNFHLPSLL
jgi:hypothetical protein